MREALGVAEDGRLSLFETSGLPLAAFFPSLRGGIFGFLSSASFLLHELQMNVKPSFSACFGEKP